MAFKMKGSSYKMGGVKTKKTMAYMKSTAMKHNVDDNKEHQDEFGEDHSEDLQTEAEHRRAFETSNKSDNQKMSKKIVRTDLDKPMGEGKAPIKQREKSTKGPGGKFTHPSGVSDAQVAANKKAGMVYYADRKKWMYPEKGAK